MTFGTSRLGFPIPFKLQTTILMGPSFFWQVSPILVSKRCAYSFISPILPNVKVFDDGSFSDSASTFQLTDWTAHIPKEVLAKNFEVDASAFDHIPSQELYIFPAGAFPLTICDLSSDPTLLDAPQLHRLRMSSPRQVPQGLYLIHLHISFLKRLLRLSTVALGRYLTLPSSQLLRLSWVLSSPLSLEP